MSKLHVLISLAFTFWLPAVAHAATHPLPGVAPLAKCEFLKKTCAKPSMHLGVDFMVAPGTAVRAICDGTVKEDTTNRGEVGDAFLVIEHTCGGNKVFGYYGHIASTVGKGRSVTEGQVIGTVRNWPGNSHLHMGMARSYYSGNWGYRNGADDFFDFRTLLTAAPAPVRPRPPTLLKEQQSGSNVALAWQAVSGGTNYRIHIAPQGTRWRPRRASRARWWIPRRSPVATDRSPISGAGRGRGTTSTRFA